jgi:nondiscriminating aspartyl-tRNA synthetase
MKTIDPRSAYPVQRVQDYQKLVGKDELCSLHGAIHRIRDMGGFSFLMIRTPDTLIQSVLSGACHASFRSQLHEECCVHLTGRLIYEERAPHGMEFMIEDVVILSTPAEPMPFAINKRKPGQSLETELGLRPIVLRNSNRRARFRIEEGIVRGFREYLHSQGFTEIHSPKILSASAEGGANVFSLDYFGQKAFLAQSPQFYKQMMVGVYERVCEVGPVFRAERHNTARHLNEYISLDFEMGYIEDFIYFRFSQTGVQ